MNESIRNFLNLTQKARRICDNEGLLKLVLQISSSVKSGEINGEEFCQAATEAIRIWETAREYVKSRE